MTRGYLVFDVGTADVRAGVVDDDGKLCAVCVESVSYDRAQRWPHAVSFSSEALWDQLVRLARHVLTRVPSLTVTAIVSVSQRHGFVIIDRNGQDRLGIPNIDNRVDALTPHLTEMQIYQLTGRWPNGLFVGPRLQWLRNRDRKLWSSLEYVTSLSDWIGWRLTGRLAYEFSQATETALLNIHERRWDQTLFDAWAIDSSVVPELAIAGETLGALQRESARALGLAPGIPVIIGGADTQCAVHAVPAHVGDVIIVAGSTTPVVQLVDDPVLDTQARVWTNCHLSSDYWLVESNCGVTGSSYEWVCRTLFANEGYAAMEQEMRDRENQTPLCQAIMGPGAMSAKSGFPPGWGALFIPSPLSLALSRADIASSVLWDMACAIRANLEQIDGLAPVTQRRRIWGVGGGFQSATFRRMVTTLLQSALYSVPGSHQASLLGAARLARRRTDDHEVAVWDFERSSFPQTQVEDTYRQWNYWHNEVSAINSRFADGAPK